MSDDAPFHVWTAYPDNGWFTQVIEKPDGTYALGRTTKTPRCLVLMERTGRFSAA